MNKAESDRLGGYLRAAGLDETTVAEDADVVVLNTCVVRRKAEDRVLNRLSALGSAKPMREGQRIIVTGCFAGTDVEELYERFPYVDLFLPPGEADQLVERMGLAGRSLSSTSQVGAARHPGVCRYVPIMQGCDNFCTYCIVPYRRGRERSRPIDNVRREVEDLVEHGCRQVTLVGQNVNSYGRGLPGNPLLQDLLAVLADVSGLKRIRFITNHPKDMNSRLVDTMMRLENLCEHLNIPVQAGDDDVLRAMGRAYSVADYLRVIADARRIPGLGLSTDVIVGFPGETEVQFGHTLELLEGVAFDSVHVAAYSERSGTVAARSLKDDVPLSEKRRRLRQVEELQERISGGINRRAIGEIVEVLVEGRKKGKWYGRTRNDKLVFFPTAGGEGTDLTGEIVAVRVSGATAWSLQGEMVKDYRGRMLS